MEMPKISYCTCLLGLSMFILLSAAVICGVDERWNYGLVRGADNDFQAVAIYIGVASVFVLPPLIVIMIITVVLYKLDQCRRARHHARIETLAMASSSSTTSGKKD